jgi:hypothetical protein
VRKGFSIAGRVAYSANMFLKIKTVCLHVIIPEMHSFSMRPAKYFYDNPLPNYLDPKTVLIYRPHPVVAILKVTDENSRIRSRIRSHGSVSQRYEYAEPDPYQNVTEPQHCFKGGTVVRSITHST